MIKARIEADGGEIEIIKENPHKPNSTVRNHKFSVSQMWVNWVTVL